jgi:Carboxypeptidase regulatory-like domain
MTAASAGGVGMRFNRFSFRTILFALIVAFVAGQAAAQSDRGAISGTILDSSGAVVEGASIVATGVATGAVYKTTSSSTGAYRITDMQVGAYNLSVTAPGFKTSEHKGFVVQINSTSSLDITLQPGDITETLTVNADIPTLQTETSDVGTVVDKRQIMELPLALGGQGVLRAPEAFVFLTPGTTGPGSNDSSNGVFEAKLGGGQNFGNEVILDGASTARADSGSSFDQTAPSVESLTEFKVTTSTVPAEFGRTSGGVESFATRSGTNSYHGTAYDIFRNDALNANSWFNNLQGQPRNLDRKNDYGGTLGGPVWIPKLYNGRDKTFFFFSYEQFRQTQGSTNTSTVPTDAQRQGDFSSLLTTTALGTNPCDGSTIFQGQIFDPSTTQTVGGQQCRTAFPGNKVPTISAVAQNILNLIPEPTDKAASQRNFIFTTNNPILSTTMSFRIDQNLGQKHKLFFSYSSRDNENINGSPSLPNPLDTTFFSSFFTHYARVGWDYFLTPTFINHLNVGLNRVNSNSVATSVNGTDWDQAIGLTGASGPTFPPIAFNNDSQGLSSYGSPNADRDVVNSLVVSDSVSWSRGRHNLRIGVDWRAFQFSVVDQSHQSPSIGFDIAQTAAQPGQGLLTGDPFASFLLGAPSSVSLAVRSQQPRFVSNYYAAYVSDDFKVSKNLTLNLGLRYDIETPRHAATNAQSVFDLNAPNPGATGPTGSPLLGALIFGGTGPGRSGTSASGAQTYHKDFAPRIGFAYAPPALFGLFHQTVIRGGYGIYYAPLTYGDFGQALTDGFTASPSFNGSFNPAVLLDSGIPAFPPPPNLDPAQDNGGSGGGFGGVTFLAPGYGRPGMVQNWDLEIQHQFTADLILSVAYVGNHGTHLRSSLAQINNLNPEFFAMGNSLKTLITDPSAAPFTQFVSLYTAHGNTNNTVAQSLRPFPQYQSINTDCCLENLGQSTYHALLAKLERRFHNGLNLLASYTYSKTLTDADSALPAFVAFSGGGSVQNSFNLKNEKSLSYQDIPHTFVMSYIYELPVGKGRKFLNKGGVVDKVIGGWQVGGVQRYQTGQPLAFGCATGIPAYDGCIRYNRVPGQPLLSPTASSFDVGQVFLHGGTGCTANPDGTFTAPAGVATYWNCAAFIDPNAPDLVTARGYTFGNMPRIIGSVRSQGYFNEDFSIIKRLSLFESHALVLKAELFNAFNRHVFTRPDTGVQDGGFGTSFGTVNGPRNVQFTLRYDF